MKSIDTRIYLEHLEILIAEGKQVSLVVTGNSMAPFLKHRRDAVLLEKSKRPYRVGDIVLFRRENGRYVLHRICRITSQGAYLIGDGQKTVEGPVRSSRMIGIVTQARRKGKTIRPGNLWWDFFAYIWIHLIPMRSIVCRTYLVTVEFLRRTRNAAGTKK